MRERHPDLSTTTLILLSIFLLFFFLLFSLSTFLLLSYSSYSLLTPLLFYSSHSHITSLPLPPLSSLLVPLQISLITLTFLTPCILRTILRILFFLHLFFVSLSRSYMVAYDRACIHSFFLSFFLPSSCCLLKLFSDQILIFEVNDYFLLLLLLFFLLLLLLFFFSSFLLSPSAIN